MTCLQTKHENTVNQLIQQTQIVNNVSHYLTENNIFFLRIVILSNNIVFVDLVSSLHTYQHYIILIRWSNYILYCVIKVIFIIQLDRIMLYKYHTMRTHHGQTESKDSDYVCGSCGTPLSTLFGACVINVVRC